MVPRVPRNPSLEFSVDILSKSTNRPLHSQQQRPLADVYIYIYIRLRAIYGFSHTACGITARRVTVVVRNSSRIWTFDYKRMPNITTGEVWHNIIKSGRSM